MKNRTVGLLIVGISALIGFIIYSFNRALTEIVNEACVHGSTCPMWGTINFQTNISISIMASLIILGAYIAFFTRENDAVQSRKDYRQIMKTLSDEEKLVLTTIIDADGTIFQSALVEATSFSKVKVTRILDRLEGKRVIERKRRGMTNVVILR
ncbi:hypothetical protein GQ472_03965 [archaeon]|nr:hypothetical protein [archaeon]